MTVIGEADTPGSDRQQKEAAFANQTSAPRVVEPRLALVKLHCNNRKFSARVPCITVGCLIRVYTVDVDSATAGLQPPVKKYSQSTKCTVGSRTLSRWVVPRDSDKCSARVPYTTMRSMNRFYTVHVDSDSTNKFQPARQKIPPAFSVHRGKSNPGLLRELNQYTE
ncbi:hypothetical protein B0H17DRAFT_1155236 [Mycena rosella]|uniref:Uncharacterized protein n=1 Tax=Mycena rosella TaxID=1033263 RepID=A0AAD7AWH6_MYCRO|nr:hypothetical protein B0H17DRAFT_1155236 [Mycena rosella]